MATKGTENNIKIIFRYIKYGCKRTETIEMPLWLKKN